MPWVVRCPGLLSHAEVGCGHSNCLNATDVKYVYLSCFITIRSRVPCHRRLCCSVVVAHSSSKKKDLPAAQEIPDAPPLTTEDGGNGSGGPEEPQSDGYERTWRDTMDDAITIGAAIIISLGIRTYATRTVM